MKPLGVKVISLIILSIKIDTKDRTCLIFHFFLEGLGNTPSLAAQKYLTTNILRTSM